MAIKTIKIVGLYWTIKVAFIKYGIPCYGIIEIYNTLFKHCVCFGIGFGAHLQ